MTLSIGLSTALSGLSVSSEQTSVVSRNVARAGDPSATRKIVNLTSVPGAGVRIASITRAANEALFDKLLNATSSATERTAIADAVSELDQTVLDPELDASPAALLSKLGNALQQYSAAPQDSVRARAAIAAARDLTRGLNTASEVVQGVRSQADADMAQSVERVNSLLDQFGRINAEIIKGSQTSKDITDQLDQRDQLLAGLAEELGIRTVLRADNDMAIFTDSGITLFDRSARAVTFTRTGSFGPTTTGNAVMVDGVPITGTNGVMLSRSGRLPGLASIRDQIAVTYQDQLDEIARGLVEVFAESDQSQPATLPDLPGLFTYPGAAGVPASGSILTGLAGTIMVNPNADPAAGGDPARLRDGAISGNPAYLYNTSGAAGYPDRLLDLSDKLAGKLAFDPAAAVDAEATLAQFAASSVAWLEQTRQTSSNEADYHKTLLERSQAALSKVTGVNLDEEMTTLLELERSYQASTRLISAIDDMLKTLLATAA
ncbi:MAG TPA: flagellar hook-associated protein FlgK [Hyphomicrobiaceae bacterium]|jgi:flagellar hook-associated protein 1 FlgK|nr:flagellar hook-associated protein FlgK [Hyphomicrobiaceae bacterium]